MKLLRTKYWCFSAIWWGGLKKTAVQALLLVDCFPEWHVLVQAGTIPPTLADARRNVGMCAGANSQVCTSRLSRERGHDKKVHARLLATQVFLDSDRSAELPLPPLVAPTGVTWSWAGGGCRGASCNVPGSPSPSPVGPGSPGPTFSRGRAIDEHAWDVHLWTHVRLRDGQDL